ncbi:MAG: J domain-containing protein [Cyanobacteriota bacterium]|nr:J domain-containing protein [Cyanobacteriota bacterium]
MAGPNHYQLLRVPPTATRDELRQAFRALSKRYHPDTTALPAADAERVFHQLRHAYAVLSDPIARQRYDGELRLSAAGAPAGAAEAGVTPVSVARPAASADVRRALSGGEWLALLLLVLAVLFSLVLGVGLALARGAELVQWPDWWAAPGLDRQAPPG